MLEYTLLFSVFSIFLLALYFKISSSHQHAEDRNVQTSPAFREPIPGIEKIFKNLSLALAIISFLTAFAFAMIGDPTVTTIYNATVFNFSSNATIANGVSAGNTTIQLIPVLRDYTRTTTTSFSVGQTNFINAVYRLFMYLLFFFALILTIVYAVRYVRLLKNVKLKKGGFNDQAR